MGKRAKREQRRAERYVVEAAKATERKAKFAAKLAALRCPACGAPEAAIILYGQPPYSSKPIHHWGVSRVMFGGCPIGDNDPAWQCWACKFTWGRVALPFTAHTEKAATSARFESFGSVACQTRDDAVRMANGEMAAGGFEDLGHGCLERGRWGHQLQWAVLVTGSVVNERVGDPHWCVYFAPVYIEDDGRVNLTHREDTFADIDVISGCTAAFTTL